MLDTVTDLPSEGSMLKISVMAAGFVPRRSFTVFLAEGFLDGFSLGRESLSSLMMSRMLL